MMLCIPASASQTLDMQQKSGLLDNDCLVSFLQGKNVPFYEGGIMGKILPFLERSVFLY